ncbi:hypothetical protein [Streptomyces sp. NPDC058667]|uniref:hypothetical protein n=1 Tax=Streptomyces sp. NPDC058667 TaxID=3346588 RepID=UPI003653227E
MSTKPAEIRYCEHAVRIIHIEGPVITEMVAAMAHLEKALATDPHDSTAFYSTERERQMVPGWVRENAHRLREFLDELVGRYTDPGTGLLHQATTTATAWTDPATGRVWDLSTDHLPRDDQHRRPGVVWRYRGLHAADGAPILHPHTLPERTPCVGSCWPVTAVATTPVLNTPHG